MGNGQWAMGNERRDVRGAAPFIAHRPSLVHLALSLAKR
jgi:hypothetical protein